MAAVRDALVRVSTRQGRDALRPSLPPNPSARGNSPRGLTRRTTRKARCPARICHSGFIAAPTVCATPMIMPPDKRAPERAQPADDHRFEGIDQARRADGRIEIGAGPEIERGDGDDDHGDTGRHREDAVRPDAHQPGRHRIVGGGAKGAAEGGAVEELVEPDDDGDGREEGQQRHDADGDRAEADRSRFHAADRNAPAVGGKAFQQRVLDDDRQPESDKQRRQDVARRACG